MGREVKTKEAKIPLLSGNPTSTRKLPFKSAWQRSSKSRSTMALELTAQECEEAVHSLKKYFSSELGEEIGDLRAKLLLNYVLKEIAPLAYNRGVQDSEEFFRKRLEDLSATCFEPPFTFCPAKKKK
jgi:uncharacterized protein (DUF2164 family)